MYSDLPHVHGADRRGVRGCTATVLRPRANYLSHLACHVHGCWRGRWDTGHARVYAKCSVESVLEKSWIFLPLFVRTLSICALVYVYWYMCVLVYVRK